MAKVEKKKGPEKIQVTLTELLVLQNTDRSRADVRKWWYALQNAEQIHNPNRSRLYDLYERVRLDGHLSGLIQKRVDAVLNKTLYYEVNKKRVDEMDDLIQSEVFRQVVGKILEKKYFGLVGLEFLVAEELSFKEINRKHIKPEKGIITEEQNGQEGYEYKDMWNVLVVEDSERFGLFLKCCPYTIWKSGSLGDLAQYIEIFGQPIRKAKYDGDDLETKAELKKALQESGGSVTIMIPNQAEIEIIGDHVTNGSGEVHKVMFTVCNNELSVIILGNTETTSNENGGSNAKSKEHGKQQLEITKSDLIDVENILSSKEFQTILKSYGYPVSIDGKGKFIFEKEIDLDELTKDKEIDSWLGSVVPLADDYYYDKYGRPKPDNYDELKAKMEEEKAIKLQPPMPTPGPGKPANKPKPKNLADYDWDFEPDEDDAGIVQKVKAASKAFLDKLAVFFGQAR